MTNEYKTLLNNLKSLKTTKPSDSFKESLYSLIVNLPDEKTHKSFLFIPFHNLRLAAIAILIFFISGTGVAIASQNAQPGSIFYPIRQAMIEARISFSTKPQEKAVLNMEKSQIKLLEIEKFIDEKENEKVESALYDYGKSLKDVKKETDSFKKADNETTEKIIKGLEKQERTLEQIMENAPENSKEPLQKAIDAASEAKENTSQVQGSSTENNSQNPQENKENEKSGEINLNINEDPSQNKPEDPAKNRKSN